MKTQDYICGDIKVRGKKVCDIYANYMGFCDIGGVRYWDIREMEKVWFPIRRFEPHRVLESDSSKRLDSITLKSGDIPQAQIAKEQLENLQRSDRKLREEVQKRRNAGGPKHVLPPRANY